jgi:hypothetical protein
MCQMNVPKPVSNSPDDPSAVALDLRHHFARPEAVAEWKRIVADGAYAGYRNCKASLRALLQSPESRSLLASARLREVYILGGGSPEKEALVLAAASAVTTQPLRCLVVDLSEYMIAESLRGLGAWAKSNRVEIALTPLVAPFERLDANIGLGQGGRLFVLLGVTFGNLKEDQVLSALARASRPGDIAIVTAECVDEQNLDAFRAQLLANYRSEAGLDFIASGLVGEDADDSEFVNQRKALSVNVVDAFPEYSAVPGTIAAVTMTNISGAPRPVAISKRYREAELIAALWKYGFVPALPAVPAPGAPHFKQFVFKRV